MGEEPEKGFEPLAPRLQGACSDQLSYSGDRHIVDAGTGAVLRHLRGREVATDWPATILGGAVGCPTMGVASIHATEDQGGKPMAEEKPRAPRARKKTTEADGEAVVGKASAKRSSGTKTTASAAKATTKKKTPTAPRAKKSQPVVVEPADVATLAYLLWERGEPGDAAEHWLRAEHELKAA